MTRKLLIAAVCLLGAILLAGAWLMFLPARGPAAQPVLASAANPGLEVRYRYDAKVFKPAPYDARSEFPLRLDAADWSFYGKRMRGLGTMLAKDPQPVLYNYIMGTYLSSYQEF